MKPEDISNARNGVLRALYNLATENDEFYYTASGIWAKVNDLDNITDLDIEFSDVGPYANHWFCEELVLSVGIASSPDSHPGQRIWRGYKANLEKRSEIEKLLGISSE